MSTAVGVRPVVGSGSLSSDSESSGSDRDTGRFKVKSAVVQAGRKEASQPSSPSSSLSRTPSPLPHATFPPHPPSPPPFHQERIPSPSPPPRAKRQRERSWSPRPTQRDGRQRSRSHSPGGRRRRRESPQQERSKDEDIEEGEVREEEKTPPPKKKKEEIDPLFTRTGGAYIPPAKLRMMQQQIQDKSSVAYQRIAWEALKKSINGLINKVNVSNIGNIVQELFQENIVRGRGLLVRSVLQAQAASPTFTHVYAALVAIINTKFPHIGELLAKRLILQFRKSFQRNNKAVCVTTSKFLAHLVNQLVLHEIIALELLTLLLEEPTDDSVEVAVGFLKECGLKLIEVSSRGVHAVFETLRSILHSGQVTSRVQYMIEVMFAIRKDKFKEHPTVLPELDLVQEEDQITHLLSLGDSYDGEDMLNVFQADDDYLTNEEKYKEIKSEILGEGTSGSEESSGDESDDEESGEEDEEGQEEGEKMDITDKTDSKALSLRRTIYLTIMSSLDYEECAHKLLKTKEDGQEPEIAMMLVECCSQERSYLRFFGLLGQRFCMLNKAWVEAFDYLFQEQYATVHRLETNKLRNVAKFFAQLFYSDALPWTGMSCIHLNEEETNSSSRIFVKILFQELAEFMGIAKLNERLRDPVLAEAFEGLLPRDNPKNTRFAINFFTSIGLGGLTDDLREHLKNVQKQIMAQKQEVSSSDTSSSDSESGSSESGSSESSSESSEESEDSEEERKRRRGRGRGREERRRREKKKEVQREEEDRRGREKQRKERGKRRSSSEDIDGRKSQSARNRRDRGEEEKGQRRDRDRNRKKETGRDKRHSSHDESEHEDEMHMRKEKFSMKSRKNGEEPERERRRDRKKVEPDEREGPDLKEERDKRRDRGKDQKRLVDSERDLKRRDEDVERQRSRGDRSRGERGRERKRSRERDREHSSSPREGQRKR